ARVAVLSKVLEPSHASQARPITDLVAPRTYVDNWSWTSDAPDNHGPALLILQDLTDSLSLQIDWGKTYVWALQKESKKWWQAHGATFVPQGVRLELVDNVELGSFFTFGRRGCSGAFNVRCKEALSRLAKLASDPQGLPVRARIVQSGIWPYLFYGTEACLPPRSTVAGLRCFTTDPATATAVWQNVSSEELLSARSVCCRAGALQNLLHRNGWTVYASGICRGPLHQTFHVKQTSIKCIRKAVATAWADVVHDNFCHRNGLMFAPVPCPELSQKVFTKFQPWELKFLAQHYSGGFMSGAERNTWSRDDTEFCPLCSAVDSKAHRLFKCPALSQQRLAFQDVLDWVQANRPHWAHLTYVAWPQEASVLQLLFQDHPLCRHRLVQPPRAPYIEPWQLESQQLLASFAIVAQGSPTGLQTVPRAELAAIVWAHQWCALRPEQDVELYSDCQSAVDLWHQLAFAGWQSISRSCNADLLENIAPRANFAVYKVKAHRREAELASMTTWERWLTAGNEAADAAAKAACGAIPSVVQEAAQRVATESSTDTRYLRDFCKAILAIGPVETKLRSA
ncbi:unnamed protein product, partial [Symbiodinium necroappetens]